MRQSFKERVYVVKGASKLLLQYLPSYVLTFYKNCQTYSVKAVQCTPDHHPLRSGIKEDIVKQYRTLFKVLGKLESEHTTHPRERAKPFCLTTLRLVPLQRIKKVQEKIKHMLHLGVVEPIYEPTEWSSPIVVVPRQTEVYRYVLTSQNLAKHITKKSFTCQQLKIHWEALQKDPFSPKLMLIPGFPNSPKLRKCQLTTFITPFGRYMFKQLPLAYHQLPNARRKRMYRELSIRSTSVLRKVVA